MQGLTLALALTGASALVAPAAPRAATALKAEAAEVSNTDEVFDYSSIAGGAILVMRDARVGSGACTANEADAAAAEARKVATRRVIDASSGDRAQNAGVNSFGVEVRATADSTSDSFSMRARRVQVQKILPLPRQRAR